MGTVCTLNASWMDTITINGYASMEYEHKLTGPAGAKADEHGSLDADGFDLVMNFQPTDRFRYAVDLTWEHGAATEDGRGNVAVEYSFSEYAFSDALKVRFGKMFTAFGIYNEIHTAKPAFLSVKEPYTTNKIYKSAGGPTFFPRWGTGLALVGSVDWLEGVDYNLMITNGTVEPTGQGGTGDEYNPHDKDHDDFKAIGFRTRASLTSSWQVGMSLYTERYALFDEENLSYSQAGYRDLSSYGLQLIGDISDEMGLEVEIIGGIYKDTTQAGVVGDLVHRLGYTIMPFYTPSAEFWDKFTFYTRYEQVDADTNVNSTQTYRGSVITIVPGFNYEFASQGTSRLVLKTELKRVTADAHTYYASKADAGIGSSLSFTELRMSMSASF